MCTGVYSQDRVPGLRRLRRSMHGHSYERLLHKAPIIPEENVFSSTTIIVPLDTFHSYRTLAHHEQRRTWILWRKRRRCVLVIIIFFDRTYFVDLFVKGSEVEDEEDFRGEKKVHLSMFSVCCTSWLPE